MKRIGFKRDEGVEMPKYQTEGSVGMDVRAHRILKAFKGDQEISEEKLEKIKDNFEKNGRIMIRSFERVLIGTGLYPQLPENTELQVRSRSGMSLKKGLVVMNQPGTVDSDYTGEIGVILYNSTPFLIGIEKGERIAQLVANTVDKPIIKEVLEIEETKRGSGGFGSTGTD